VEPGFGCISPVSKQWNAKQENPAKYLANAIRVTKALGGRSFRVFVGGASDRAAGTSIPSLMESAIQGIRSVRSQALDAGVKVAIENHGEFLARQVKTVIEEAGRDIASSCLDSGNPVMLGEDPLLSLETLAPYVTSTHIRDSVIYEHPRGAAVQWVALGDGSVDLLTFTRRFRELCPQAPMLLEIITGRPPAVLPFLEPGYWKGFADTPAADFARFVALAKKGHPFMKTMLIPDAGTVPEEYRAALVLQERRDLERSLEYARKTMDVGVKWRS
jgi:sugar phosphate isomerase/epimerase